jgi:SSS family solute:Na+ symporter
MSFTFLDLAVFIGFYAVVLGFALFKSRGQKDSEDFFLGGRTLTWPLIGLSIVAANISTEQMVGMAGQSAGGTGLAVSAWQLVGSVGIVIIAFTLLPRFLRAGIYTMPEYLEYRYNTAARSIMAIFTVIIYTGVLLTAVLYSGGLTIQTIFGLKLTTGVWILGIVAALYTTWGGLKAVAWADLFQGMALLVGGMLIFALGLHAAGGWGEFAAKNSAKLHMILPATNADLPWTGVVSGMWIVILYYCGLNQFIVQRNLAAKTLRHGQLGVIFAGGLWLLVPFAIVMPGIIAQTLYKPQLIAAADQANQAALTQFESLKTTPAAGNYTVFSPDEEWRARFPDRAAEIEQYNTATRAAAASAGAQTAIVSLAGSKPDAAFPTLVKQLIPQGLRGFILAAIAGAIISSLASMMNSAATIFTMDVYNRFIDRNASQLRLVLTGRIVTVVCMVIGCLMAPELENPKFGGVFQFIQQFQGYIWPGVAAVFLVGMLVPQAPPAAGVAGLLAGPAFYWLFQQYAPNVHFLIQVAVAFQLVLFVMGLITFYKPLAQPRSLPVREGIELHTDPIVYIWGWLVIAGVAVFFIVFR